MDSGGEPPTVTTISHSDTSGNILKIVVVLLIAYIIYVVIEVVRGIGNSSIYKNIANTFDSLTAAVAYAAQHWYWTIPVALVGVVALGAIQKYAATKIEQMVKSTSDPKVQEVMTDSILSKAKSDQASKLASAGEAEEAAKAAQISVEKAGSATEGYDELDDDQKAKVTEISNELDVPFPAAAKGKVRMFRMHNNQLIWNDVPISQ